VRPAPWAWLASDSAKAGLLAWAPHRVRLGAGAASDLARASRRPVDARSEPAADSAVAPRPELVHHRKLSAGSSADLRSSATGQPGLDQTFRRLGVAEAGLPLGSLKYSDSRSGVVRAEARASGPVAAEPHDRVNPRAGPSLLRRLSRPAARLAGPATLNSSQRRPLAPCLAAAGLACWRRASAGSQAWHPALGFPRCAGPASLGAAGPFPLLDRAPPTSSARPSSREICSSLAWDDPGCSAKAAPRASVKRRARQAMWIWVGPLRRGGRYRVRHSGAGTGQRRLLRPC
jgi:hypothetical protein